MSKYNLTEKKVKAPLYRTLLSPKVVEELYQQIKATFIVEKTDGDPEDSAHTLADE